MTTLTTHIDIRVDAKDLDGETFDGYERLLQPFLKPPRDNMCMNLDKHTVGYAVSCKVHVYGRCVLDDDLKAAVFDFVGHVPEARIVLSHGAQTVQTPFASVQAGRSNQLSRAALDEMLAGDAYQIVLTGKAHVTEKHEQPKLRLVG